MTTRPAAFPRAQGWLRWALVAVPMAAAMLRAADVRTWLLIGVTLALSIPLLWLHDVGVRPLTTASALALIASTGALWVLHPGSWSSVAMFSTTFFLVLKQSTVPIVLAIALDAGVITTWAARHHLWDDALSTYAVLAVIVLMALNRRARLARVEQTELA